MLYHVIINLAFPTDYNYIMFVDKNNDQLMINCCTCLRGVYTPYNEQLFSFENVCSTSVIVTSLKILSLNFFKKYSWLSCKTAHNRVLKWTWHFCSTIFTFKQKNFDNIFWREFWNAIDQKPHQHTYPHLITGKGLRGYLNQMWGPKWLQIIFSLFEALLDNDIFEMNI